MSRPTLRAVLLVIAMSAAHPAAAIPFVVEDMPANMDSVIHPWTQARSPVAADFNGDGQPSWYAGGNQVAHPKEPTPIDPLRYATRALPTITSPTCPGCIPNHLAFAVADFDRDGVQDIARINDWTAQSVSHTLQIFEGTGSDNFTLADRRDYNDANGNTLGENFVQLRAADFDRDGDPDLAILTTYQNRDTQLDVERGHLRIRWNNNGAFDAETILQSVRFHKHSRLVSGDFDSDGDVDIMVNYEILYALGGGETRWTRVFSNQGDGSFVSESNSNIELLARDEPLFLADIDRNSHPEWIVASDRVHRRAYTLGSGWANSTTDYTPVLWEGHFFNPGYLARSLPAALADMDEDGRIDLVTAQGTVAGEPNQLVLHRTQANNTGAAAEVIATFNASIASIGAGDARGDADQDLLVRLEGGAFRLVRNTAPRLAPEGSVVAILPMPGLTRLESADGDRDGDQDLFALLPRTTGSHLEQFLGNGSGGFSAGEFKILSNTPKDFVMADFNQDGRVDYAYTVPNANAVRLVTQSDASFFVWPDTLVATYAGASEIETGQVLIYDGRPDLFVGSSSSGGLLALRNGTSAWSSSTPRASWPTPPNALVVLPRYGVLSDSPAACSSDGLSFQIQAYSLSIGWSQSAQLTQVQTVGQTGVCAAVNLDDDAELEMVFVSGDGRLASWNPSNAPASPYGIISNIVDGAVRAITSLDYNQDGLADLLVSTDQNLALYYREGADDAWKRRPIGSSTVPRHAIAADFNLDSLPDFAFTTDTGIEVVINESTIGDEGSTRYPNGQTVTVAPSQTLVTSERQVVNPGRPNEDASIAVTQSSVVFYKVVRNGSQWSIGDTMTPAEVQQAVASVSVLVDGVLLGTSATTLVANDGRLQINYSAALGNLVPIAPAEANYVQFRVTLKPGAAAANYSEFVLAGSFSTTRALGTSGPVGRSTPLRTFTSSRIQIEGWGMLFGNGFE